MSSTPVSTYLRFLRKKCGLRQKDLARLLGTVTASQVSRHERSVSPPSIFVALGYQVVFGRPVSEIFPGLYHAIEEAVESRLTDYEREIGDSELRGKAALPIAIQTEWLNERKTHEI
jgi:transcriptional regulator with XRE-family HTH domain